MPKHDLHRTLVEIVGTYLFKSSFTIAKAKILSWDGGREEVEFYYGLIDFNIQEKVNEILAKGKPAYLFAEVSIGVNTSEELEYANFELPL